MAPIRTKDKVPTAATVGRSRRSVKEYPAQHSPSKPTFPLTSLQTYLSNVFYLVHVQDQNDISEATFERNWSKEGYHAMVNGEPFNRDQIHTFIKKQRASMSNRQLVSQAFTVVPGDEEGRSGTAADTVRTTGTAVIDGKEQDAVATTTAVIVVVWDEESGKRVIQSENLVFVIEPQSD